MEFKLNIHCDNAAFTGEDTTHGAEVARILIATAARVLAGEGVYYETILDVNGNDVGRFKFIR